MEPLTYIAALIDQWERQMRTADEVVREIRKTLAEESAIVQTSVRREEK